MTTTKIVVSDTCTNEKNAWEYFDEELKYWLYWLKGYKYWRVLPKLRVSTFPWIEVSYRSKCNYQVTARIIISEEKIKGYTEVSLVKPYPTELPKSEFEDGEGKYYGFGFTKLLKGGKP